MSGKNKSALLFAVCAVLAIGLSAPASLFAQSYGERELFNCTNIYAVQNSPEQATTFTLDRAHVITYVMTYHYFNNGVFPGYISLIHSDGRIYGPWKATGNSGQGGVPNAYWEIYPDVELKPGTYLIADSDMKTWSKNAESGYRGQALVRGYPATTYALNIPAQPAPTQYPTPMPPQPQVYGQTGSVPYGLYDLAGDWDIVGNGSRGTISVTSQQGSRFSGTVYTEKLVDGNQSGVKVSFTRMWTSGFKQDFSGSISVGADGKLAMTGTFTQMGAGSYVWTATKR